MPWECNGTKGMDAVRKEGRDSTRVIGSPPAGSLRDQVTTFEDIAPTETAVSSGRLH